MILPDVNVLIYAFRADSTDQLRYKAWLEQVDNGPAAYGMSPQGLASLARICTHPRIFSQPSTMDEILDFYGALLGQPNSTVVVPGQRHWPLFGQLCLAAKATGNLVQDAWSAALAIETGCEWITTDHDYSRFSGLRWSSPF